MQSESLENTFTFKRFLKRGIYSCLVIHLKLTLFPLISPFFSHKQQIDSTEQEGMLQNLKRKKNDEQEKTTEDRDWGVD